MEKHSTAELVRAIMEENFERGVWMTIAEVAMIIDRIQEQSSVSAAIRALRNIGYTVLKRKNVDDPQMGLYQYKICNVDELSDNLKALSKEKGLAIEREPEKPKHGIFKFMIDSEQVEKLHDMIHYKIGE